MEAMPILFSMSSTSDEPKTGVFWDLSDFPVPDELDPATVCQNIKLALKKVGYGDDVFVWAYLPGGKTFSKHSEREYVDAGITTICTREDKYPRLNRMILDILLWSGDNPAHYPGPNILVISKDVAYRKTTFLGVLRTLQVRYFHVFLVMPDDTPTPNASLPFVKSKWHWRALSSGGEPITESSSSLGDKGKSREDISSHN